MKRREEVKQKNRTVVRRRGVKRRNELLRAELQKDGNCNRRVKL